MDAINRRQLANTYTHRIKACQSKYAESKSKGKGNWSISATQTLVKNKWSTHAPQQTWSTKVGCGCKTIESQGKRLHQLPTLVPEDPIPPGYTSKVAYHADRLLGYRREGQAYNVNRSDMEPHSYPKTANRAEGCGKHAYDYWFKWFWSVICWTSNCSCIVQTLRLWRDKMPIDCMPAHSQTSCKWCVCVCLRMCIKVAHLCGSMCVVMCWRFSKNVIIGCHSTFSHKLCLSSPRSVSLRPFHTPTPTHCCRPINQRAKLLLKQSFHNVFAQGDTEPHTHTHANN